MNLRILGAGLIMSSCGMLGYLIGRKQRHHATLMREYIRAIDYITQELQYRRNSLVDMFDQASAFIGGIIGDFFHVLSIELEKQVAPNIQICIDAALSQTKEIPTSVSQGITLLRGTLGCFDLDGQISELEKVREECKIILQRYVSNQDVRIRNCQTLALCAGAAIIIVFI